MPDRLARLLLFCRWAIAVCLLPIFGGLLFLTPSVGSDLRRTPIVRAVQKARPSVVNISGEKTVNNTVSMGQTNAGHLVNGMGTGVVIDPRGYIVTNYHVVNGVRQIQVTLADGQIHTAQLINRDPETDLAIIKINLTAPLPVIDIGSSSDLMPGEPVVAVGNAYGYEHTVTQGIISALNRNVTINETQLYNDLIQTDASINPGNSGGPLLNIDGEMIGINVAVRAGAQGIGFTIPVDKAMEVVTKLIASCSLQQDWHGLKIAQQFDVEPSGVVVTSIQSESPAAKSGVQQGDLLTAIDGEPIRRTLDFHRAFLDRRQGDRIDLSILRDEESLTANLVMVNKRMTPNEISTRVWELLGLKVQSIPSTEFKRYYAPYYQNRIYFGGLSVIDVRSDSPAKNNGLRRGDALVGMGGYATISLNDMNYIIDHTDFSNSNQAMIKIRVLRGNDPVNRDLLVTLR